MNKVISLGSLIVLLICLGCQQQEEEIKLRLWYTQPAAEWTEALPVGNGRLGAMVFGNPWNERVQLNEESLWAGSRINSNNPLALENLPVVQQLIMDGKLEEAEELIDQTMLSTPLRVRSNQTLGDLLIDYPSGDTAGYYRELDLSDGISRTRFSLSGTTVLQEVFSSAPGDMIVIRLKSSGEEKLNIGIRLEREQDAITETWEHGLIMNGQIDDPEDPERGPGGKHMRFSTALKVVNDGGLVNYEGNSIRIEDTNEVVLLLTAATDYNLSLLNFDPSIDPEQVCMDILSKEGSKSYKQLLNDHLKEYQSLFPSGPQGHPHHRGGGRRHLT